MVIASNKVTMFSCGHHALPLYPIATGSAGDLTGHMSSLCNQCCVAEWFAGFFTVLENTDDTYDTASNILDTLQCWKLTCKVHTFWSRNSRTLFQYSRTMNRIVCTKNGTNALTIYIYLNVKNVFIIIIYLYILKVTLPTKWSHILQSNLRVFSTEISSLFRN